MITKLKLTNFKNFRQAEIKFGPLSILVGANASGKSNIRDALRFLHGIARGYTLAEILGEKYGEGGQLQWSGIRGGTREASFFGEDAFTIAVEFERKKQNAPAPDKYSYEITIDCGPDGLFPRVRKEQLYQSGSVVFDTHSGSGDPVQDQSRHLLTARISRRRRRGEQLQIDYPEVVGTANQPLLTQVLELAVHQSAVGSIAVAVDAALDELEAIRFIDFSPELMRKPSIPGQLILSDRGDNLSSVLHAMCEKPELKRALTNWIQELTPMDVVDFEFVQDAAGKILVYLVEEGGRKVSANSASDGTLRFLGMLAALLGPKPAKLYFLEEIDNGIHPTRLSLLMDLMASSSKNKAIQIVATTHSPQVLRLIRPDDMPYTSLVYRLKGSAEGRLKSLTEIPDLMEVIKRQDIARLYESSWMENTMEFAEGAIKPFPIEAEVAL